MDTEDSYTPEERWVASIESLAADFEWPSGTPEQVVGALVSETLTALVGATHELGTGRNVCAALRLNNVDPLALAVAVFRLTAAIRDPRVPLRLRGAQRPMFRTLGDELVYATVRTADRQAVDRGFRVRDADQAWEFALFSVAAAFEQLACAVGDSRGHALDEAELSAFDALTSIVVMFVRSCG